jgi:alpha-tubulin suppressor-like RCC1 family protein
MSVIEIARGNEGALYACGGNDCGQLCLEGIGESSTLRFIPPSIVGPVVYVSAGCSHTYIISSSTAVFGCGSNHRGQLAVDEADDSAPQRARWLQCCSFTRLKIIQIACGESHTIALGVDGELFAWGAGDGGRLGLGDVRSRVSPERLTFFRGRSSDADDGSRGTVGSISCGYHHSLAVTGYLPLGSSYSPHAQHHAPSFRPRRLLTRSLQLMATFTLGAAASAVSSVTGCRKVVESRHAW